MSDIRKPTGRLWKNLKKTMDKHPDMRGELELTSEVVDDIIRQRALINSGDMDREYVKIEVVGWAKHGPRAGKYLSLKGNVLLETDGQGFTPKPAPPPPPPPPPESDDEIPF